MADTDSDLDDDMEEDEAPELEERGEDVSRLKSVEKQLLDIFNDVEKGYIDQWERSNNQTDWWEIYNCKLNAKQFYSGHSQIYVPIVHNAINARKTRFTNQIFPVSGRNVEVTASDGSMPYALMALLEHYIKKAKLRTKVMPALVRNGDVEGQYNIYVSWSDTKRHVTWRTKKLPEIEDSGIENPIAEPVDDIHEEEITDGHPSVEVLSDSDVLVQPQTSDTLEEAIEAGGAISIIRRWTKGKIRKMIKEGAIRKDAGEDLIEQMESKKDTARSINRPKDHVDAAGIKGKDTKYAQVYETFTILKVRGERRLYQAFYGGEQKILGCRRNPNWSDRLPLLSVPVEKVSGAFKGISKVKPCADLQYEANDAINEAADSAAFSAMPIVMTDPEKNPRVGSMVLSLAAVWETSPKDTQIVTFPPLWQFGFERVNNCKAEVSQTLGVSPAAITQGYGAQMKSKPNQAQIAQEQQVDILSTADAVTVLEEGILTPLLARFIELDHQYRDEEITVKQFGQMGVEADLEEIPPVQMGHRYVFRWFGVEQARSAQQIQQQIAGMNVIRGIPPQQMNGYQVNLVPIITQLVENTFGPRLAPLIFVSPQQQLPVPVGQENALLMEGYEVPTHAMDDDQAHVQGHNAALRQMEMAGENKNKKKFLAHIWQHMQQMQAKQQAMQQPQQGAPGVPGGAGPGVAGTPRQGAQVAGPRSQGPPGMIAQDQMQDPRVMPRKVG